MRVLVNFECSGVVRRAFRARGHDAWSCDLKPAEDGSSFHIQSDGYDVAYSGDWDLMIAHPVCRYMANSGAKHLYLGMNKKNGPDLERFRLAKLAAFDFVKLRRAPVKKIAIENPIMHGYAKLIVGPQSQVIHPWQHGHGEQKATCLWLKNLPLIVPSNIVTGREQRIWKLPPGPEREAERSRTFEGIGEAFANQWG